MAVFNSSTGYGQSTKILHWLIVLLFSLQFTGGLIMTRMAPGQLVLGLNGDQYYNWHESLGLIALFIAVLRLVNRGVGRLPDWAPTLSAPERVFAHRSEQGLYTAMLLMPISGFLFVMSAGYGILLFGVWNVPNPIGKVAWLAPIAEWTHILCAIVLAALVLGHIVLVLGHVVFQRDGLLRRML